MLVIIGYQHEGNPGTFLHLLFLLARKGQRMYAAFSQRNVARSCGCSSLSGIVFPARYPAALREPTPDHRAAAKGNSSFMLDHETLIQSLRSSILFQGVDDEEVQRIVAAGQWKTVAPGEFIYQQGDNHRHFYLLASGAVELTLNVEGGGQHLVGQIGPGGHFGETSLLTGSCNSLNARALNRTTLLCFTEQVFRSVLLANTTMQHQLNVALAKRLRISFHDHADLLAKRAQRQTDSSRNLDPTFFSESAAPPATSEKQPPHFEPGLRFAESTIARQINKAVQRFGKNLDPVLLSGEPGTGRRMIASEIHRASAHGKGSYSEIDIRSIDPVHLEMELFGHGPTTADFSQIASWGFLSGRGKEPSSFTMPNIWSRTASGSLPDYSREPPMPSGGPIPTASSGHG